MNKKNKKEFRNEETKIQQLSQIDKTLKEKKDIQKAVKEANLEEVYKNHLR